MVEFQCLMGNCVIDVFRLNQVSRHRISCFLIPMSRDSVFLDLGPKTQTGLFLHFVECGFYMTRGLTT